MSVRILKGDCREVLRELPDESVHCCITSPPYWGLRDYGVTGQIGLEGSFAGYIEQMRNVFAEVKRVLRKDGTLWLNLGDSYAGGGHGGGGSYESERNWRNGNPEKNGGNSNRDGLGRVTGLKPKDLCGIPWRVAFALQADGWYLRSDIIWSKPNPMPESVTDRPTKAHEYLFLLSKSERYFYDAVAVREENSERYQEPTEWMRHGQAKTAAERRDGAAINANGANAARFNGLGRNRRSVWEIATSPFPEAHFATFPPALVEPCIKAGTSEKGCCAKCGAPWVRETEVTFTQSHKSRGKSGCGNFLESGAGNKSGGWNDYPSLNKNVSTLTWLPSCNCGGAGWRHGCVPCTVLDPFGGAGTTGLVADRLGRNAILIELNPDYADMAERRIANDAGMFASVAAE